MATFLEGIIDRAKADKQTILLPEADDERTLKAAEKVLADGIADVVLLGDSSAIDLSGYQLDGATFVDPMTDSHRDELVELLYETRKKKGMTIEQAGELMKDPVWYGILMIKAGLGDGLVSGARHATIDILKPALQVIRTAPGASMVSSFFIMLVPDCDAGKDGMLFFADPALVVQPTSEELANIAVATAESYEWLVGEKPNVALLSHSTYGSVHNDDAEKIVEAVKLAKAKESGYNIDGEMQADAALVPEIGASKAPDSPVAGKADVLVFPDLDAANIGYKLVQRLAKAEAYGPILQGLAAPLNDLSRGCSAEDIVAVVALTALQAQARKA